MSRNIIFSVPIFVFCLLFSVALVTGVFFGFDISFVDFSLTTFLLYFMSIIVIIPLLYILFVKLYCWISNRAIKDVRYTDTNNLKVWIIVMVTLVICWLPVWLAYYPGLWNYDPNQVYEYLNNHYSQFHPLIHTLLLSVCYSVGTDETGSNKGVILYDIIQMIIMSSIFSYAFVYVKNHIRNRVFLIIMLVFFAFFPFNSILVISSTKDIIFSGLVLLNLIFSLRLLEEDNNKTRKRIILMVFPFTSTLMLMFRNNAKYAFVLMLIVSLVLVVLKKLKAKVLVYLLLCMTLFVVSDKALVYALDAESGSIAEVMSIPSQQMGRIREYLISNEQLDIEDEQKLEEIDSFYSPNAQYDPQISDRMKNELLLNNADDIIRYIKLSAELFLKYPRISIDSYLYLTQGDWNLGDVSNAEVYGSGLDTRQGYLLTDVKEGYGITHDSKVPWLESILERAFSDNEYQSWPILSVLFAPALYVWLFLFVVFGLINIKSSRYILPLSFIVFWFFTVLAGPCVVIRYVYPLVISSFVLVTMLMCELKKEGLDNQNKPSLDV